MTDIPTLWLLCLALAQLGLIAWLTLRPPPVFPESADALDARQRLLSALAAQAERLDRLERELRREVSESARGQRQEVTQTLTAFQDTLLRQGAETTRTQNAQIDAFAQQLVQLRGTLGDTLTQQLQALSEANARRLGEVRATLEAQLQQLQQSNAGKLDEMRATVDEKLHKTLEARLSESFQHVAQRLEQVHKGLGEMQTLAAGVGDLKHLLTNVKTRGMFGEAQLAGLLEQVFTPEQYATQVPTRPGSRHVVDFAIRLPGKRDDGAPVWLPIDAKFPNEDYERLLEAQRVADPVAAEAAAKALEA
ncbi:DNA recombination protein RmuC, partial [Aquabacterium sp. A08]|uniref:DNA recombination protein RmuC n=1 Tax=Aquabacterium sp. A08 TaxID=2718532 RepID=UPI0014221924